MLGGLETGENIAHAWLQPAVLLNNAQLGSDRLELMGLSLRQTAEFVRLMRLHEG